MPTCQRDQRSSSRWCGLLRPLHACLCKSWRNRWINSQDYLEWPRPIPDFTATCAGAHFRRLPLATGSPSAEVLTSCRRGPLVHVAPVPARSFKTVPKVLIIAACDMFRPSGGLENTEFYTDSRSEPSECDAKRRRAQQALDLLSPEEMSVVCGADRAAFDDAGARKSLDIGSAHRISRLRQMKRAMMEDPVFRNQYSSYVLTST